MIGGKVPNADCVFPFVFKHAVYRKCTKAHATKLWCATEVDSDGNYLYGKWGYCDPWKCLNLPIFSVHRPRRK